MTPNEGAGDQVTVLAAARWATTWERAWPAGDTAGVAALYAAGAVYRSHPFRAPEPGSALGYVTRTFAEESDVVCRFNPPLVTGRHAAVEWWSTWREGDETVTLAGVTLLTFDEAGLVTGHTDYWAAEAGAQPPYPGWGRSPEPDPEPGAGAGQSR